jgi:hypothetical protein
MKIITCTSDFEKVEMNGLGHFFGGPGKGKHLGGFFLLKQAWHKYLAEKCNMSFAKSLGPAMERGGMDILCIFPQDEIVPFGIPYLGWTLEVGINEWEIKGWDIIWKFFQRQWIPLIPNWNIPMDDGTIQPTVNCTNNALGH